MAQPVPVPVETISDDNGMLLMQGLRRKQNPSALGRTPRARPFYINTLQYIMTGDFNSHQDDLDEAAYRGVEYIGDPTGIVTATSQVTIPQNLRADFRHQRWERAFNFSGSTALWKVMGSVGGKDYSYIRNVLLQNGITSETLPSGKVVQRVDYTKAVDAIQFGDDLTSAADYIRYMRWQNIRIMGFRHGIRFLGSNCFIIDVLGFSIAKCWGRGLSFESQINSGEKITVSDGQISEMRNKIGNGPEGIGVYTDGLSQDPAINTRNISVDYCQVSADVSRGQWNLDVAGWLESAIDLPIARQRRVGGKPATSLRLQSKVVTQGPIGNDSDWTGYGVESPGGRPVLIERYGSGHSTEINFCEMGNYALGRNTEIYRDMDGGEASKTLIGHTTDAGYVRITSANVPDASPKLGKGVPFLTSRDRNDFHFGTTQATYLGAFTSFTSWGVGSARYLPRGGGLGSARINASAAATTGFGSQQHRANVGDRTQFEFWVHISEYTGGYIAGRQQFLAEDVAPGAASSLNVPADWNSEFGTAGAVNRQFNYVHPESSNAATITIPDPNSPKKGLFTPGANVRGTWALFMELSGLNGAGITGRCWIYKDNGDGTYMVHIEQGTAVTAQTIIGWEKMVAYRPVPNGARVMRHGIYANAFQGVADISGLNLEIRRN